MNNELNEYIKKAREVGQNTEQIKLNLLNAGYQKEVINSLLKSEFELRMSQSKADEVSKFSQKSINLPPEDQVVGQSLQIRNVIRGVIMSIPPLLLLWSIAISIIDKRPHLFQITTTLILTIAILIGIYREKSNTEQIVSLNKKVHSIIKVIAVMAFSLSVLVGFLALYLFGISVNAHSPPIGFWGDAVAVVFSLYLTIASFAEAILSLLLYYFNKRYPNSIWLIILLVLVSPVPVAFIFYLIPFIFFLFNRLVFL